MEPSADFRSRNDPGAPALTRIAAAILVILAGWVLHATAVVAVPIVFALFIAVVLAPLDTAIARTLPAPIAWLGRAVVLALLLAGLAVFFAGLVYAARQVMGELPRIAETLQRYLPETMPALQEIEGAVVDGAAGEATSRPGGGAADATADRPAAGSLREALNEAGSAAGSWLVSGATSLTRGVAGAVGTFVAATIIVVFMVLLGLGESATWARKVDALWPHGADWHGAAKTISRKLRAFLLVRAAMGALTAVLYVGLLWAFDLGLLTVWALLTFLLGFIPNLGSVISGILPTLYALATRDLQTAALVGAGLFAIEQVIGNWVDPRVQGRQIAISPVVVLVSILVWGWIWGAAGALLAVPIMVGLMVSCAHVPALRPVALMLSNQPDRAGLDRSLAA